jgi:hypothetical protein
MDGNEGVEKGAVFRPGYRPGKISDSGPYQVSGMRSLGTQSVQRVVKVGHGPQARLWILSSLELPDPQKLLPSRAAGPAGPRELFALGFAVLWQGCLSSAAQAKHRFDSLLRRT